MYINNPKKLFEDLTSIHTIALYLGRIDTIAEDDLKEMVNIVYHHKDELWDSNVSSGEGSTLWDLAEFEGMKDEKKLRREMINDSNKLKRIWNVIKRELGSKYVLVCNNCGKEYFYDKKPKYEADRYKCSQCKADGSLQLLLFEDWASPDIMNLRSQYVH